MTIFLIRHGATPSSGHTYAGHADVCLNPLGMTQAATIANALKHFPISTIFCSPLTRAMQTAQPLANARDVSIIQCAGLREIDFGVLEGTRKSEVQLKLRRNHRFKPIMGGESLHQVWIRLAPVTQAILALHHARADIAVFSHYWSARMLRGRLERCSFVDTCEQSGYQPGPGNWTKVCI